MSKDGIKPKDLCTPQMCRLNQEYYDCIKHLLYVYEDQHYINSKIKEILQNILLEENNTLLKTKEENGKLLLDFEKGPISFHSQTGNKTNNIEGPSVFSTRCECSPSCKGTLTYNCNIMEKPFSYNNEMSNFTILKNTSMIINLSGCESNLDYNIKGIYDGGFKNDVTVNYENGSRYNGKWKDGMPHGSGILTLTGVKREYYKICRLDVKHIKLLGDFNEGLLDESKKFKLIVVLNNIKKKDKYRIIAYENTTLYNKIFIPDKKAIIKYYNSDDENPEKCYGIFKGTINKTDRLNGVMRYSNIKAMITYYKGEFKHNQFFKGLCIFSKSHSLYSFEGKYCEDGPCFGTKKYKNGAIYIGYVNNFYHNHGEGQLNETKIHDVECKCCNTVVKTDTYCSKLAKEFFGIKEGMWMNEKLVFDHPLSKECSKQHCNNIKSVACLICKEYYCEECYEKHQNMKGSKRKFKYHDAMRLFVEKEAIESEVCLEGTNLEIPSSSPSTSPQIPIPTLPLLPPRIETKPNTLGNYLSIGVKSQQTKKKKKKKKKTNIPQDPIQLQDPVKEKPKELVITDEEKKDLESGIVNEKLMNFMSDVALQELKDRGIVNDTTREEDIKCSVKDMFSITSINNTNPVDMSSLDIEVKVDENEVFEEEQPYDSSFEDFLKEMKKQYNSDLSRKQKVNNF